MSTPKQAFIQQLENSFPALREKSLDNLVSENLISPFTVELPKAVLEQAEKIVNDIFAMRELPEYQAKYADDLTARGIKDPGNKSIAMSYDFHVDENQNLRLIEINTNASFLALGYQLYQSKNIAAPVQEYSPEEMRADILEELRLQGHKIEKPRVAIIDDKPEEQRLFVEFLVYDELFKSWGWDSKILDYRETFKNFSPDFIYNRHTDFFLTDETSKDLEKAFSDRTACVSPNPYEYFLLADKQRMIDWHKEGFLDSLPLSEDQKATIRQATPQATELKASNSEELWATRKKYFFKPKNAFGSKLSYKGASISRKHYDDLINQDIMAQEFIPAPEMTFETPEGPQKFKYDLRCYAYKGRLQLIVARIYQGQVTNLKTTYGGFACTVFK
jgi:hypothetical protein